MTEFDERQAEAIAATGNVVVSAGAGSGKTRVLTERYVRLVADGEAPVRSILTLTFTRKAAAEMHERIYRRLLERAEEPAVAAELEHFDTAQISTLDSFCAQIVRNAGREYGIPPDFRLDEEENRELAESTALEFLLEHQDDPILSRFVLANGFERVWKELFVSLVLELFTVARRTDLQGMVEAQLQQLRHELARSLRELGEARDRFCSFHAKPGSAIAKRQELIQDAEPEALVEAAQEGSFDSEEVEGELDRFDRVDKRFGNSKHPELEEIKAAVDRIKQAVKDGRAALSNLRMEEDLREAFALLEAFEARAVSAKRSHGALTYRDVMELALRILREQDDIRRYYADRFRFIMIDEFQDNNAYQKELLYLLCGSDGREPQSEKLFFVGDDKQSIYRFRGADVSVFKQLAGELEQRAGQHIRLPRNYRSSPALKRVFDYLFSRIMAGAEREYEAEYVPIESGEGSSIPVEVDAAAGEAPVQVAIKPQRDGEQAGGADSGDTEAAETEELLSNDEAEAFSIAQRIRAMIDAGEPAVEREDGTATPLRYSDIALLMRSTGNQIIFERMFRLFDIPYTTQSVRSLFLEAPAYDIYHVMQLAIYPDDRAAYAGLLRSPLVNVSDEALVRILRSGDAPFAPFSSAAVEGWGREDAERYEAGRELFDDVSARLDREPLGDVIMHIWYRYGYRYYLLRRPANHPYLEYADYFFELAQTTRYRSVAEFLDFLRANLGTYQRMPELEIVREERGGVQIMTIHKAKGLEFPVVFLANAGNTGRNEGTGTRPYFLSDAHGLTLNMPTADGSTRVNHLYEAGKAEEEAKSVAELRRLLYVALTRAESRLIITGAIKRGTSATSSHLGMVLEALGLDPSGEEPPFAAPQALSGLLTVEEIPDVGREQALRRTRHPRARDPEEAAQAYAERLPVAREPERREFAVTELNAVYARDEIAHPEERPLPAIEEDEALSHAAVEDVFGSVAHWLVREILSGRRAESWRPGPADLPSQYASSLTDERLAAELVAGADRLVTRLFASELGRRLLAARHGDTEATLYSELPFLLYRRVEDGAVWIRGQLDVALVEGSRVFVYDFKTDHLRREGEYDMQLRLYGEAARELFGGPVTTRAIYMRRPDTPYVAPDTDVDQALLARCVTRARSPGVPERAERLVALEEK